MCRKISTEEMAIKLVSEGKHEEARFLIDQDMIRELNKSMVSVKREAQWDSIKKDISSVVWFPAKAIAFIICSPLECIIRIVEAVKKKNA
jgi:hypothetical protein